MSDPTSQAVGTDPADPNDTSWNTGDSRPPVYWDPSINKWVYRSYSLGNCERQLTAFRQGITPADHPDWLLRAFKQGIENEPVILDMLYDPQWGRPWEPAPLESRQQLLEVEVGDECVIRGHVDDIAIRRGSMVKVGGELRVVEAKAFAASTLEKWQHSGWDAFPYYAVQLSVYMHALGMGALFVIGEKDEDGVVRRVGVTEVDQPPIPMWQIKAKVGRIHARGEEGGLPGCTFKQYPCQMHFIGDENGCGGAQAVTGKAAGYVDWELQAKLADSIILETLNTPAELMDNGQKLIAQGQGKLRQADELFVSWFAENSAMGDDGELVTSRYEVKVQGGNVTSVKRRHETKGPDD